MKTIRRSFPTPALPTEGNLRTGTESTPAANPRLYGTIRAVEPSYEILFLRQPEGNTEEIIHWLPQTRFLDHGVEAKPNTLRGGQQISVQFASDGGMKFAKEINIVVESPVADSTAARRRSFWPWLTSN